MYVGEEAFKVTTGERIFLSRLKPHGFIIGSPRIRVLTLFVPGGVEGSFRGMGSPAQHLDLPAGALTYSEADFKQTVRRFAEYGVRILTPDEVAVELPLYPKAGSCEAPLRACVEKWLTLIAGRRSGGECEFLKGT